MLVVEEQEGAPAAVVEQEVAEEAEGQEVVQGEEQEEEEGEWGEEIAPGLGRAETASARNVKPRHLT
jgi:hypothetical protein